MPTPLETTLFDFAHLYDALRDRFRADSYRDAAIRLGELETVPTTRKELLAVPGIGASIASKVLEHQATGRIRKLETLRADPRVQGRVALLQVAGIGPVTAKALVEKHGLRSVSDLRRAVADGSVALTHAQRLGLRFFNDLHTRIPHAEAKALDDHLQALASEDGALARARVVRLVGSYRRGAPTLGDVDILLKNVRIDELMARVEAHPGFEVVGVLSRGPTKSAFLMRLRRGGRVRHIDVLVTPPEEFAPALLYFTGSKAFNIRTRVVAKAKGWALSEHGLQWVGASDTAGRRIPPSTRRRRRPRMETETRLSRVREHASRPASAPTPPVFHTEEELLAFLGMGWVEPSAR